MLVCGPPGAASDTPSASHRQSASRLGWACRCHLTRAGATAATGTISAPSSKTMRERLRRMSSTRPKTHARCVQRRIAHAAGKTKNEAPRQTRPAGAQPKPHFAQDRASFEHFRHGAVCHCGWTKLSDGQRRWGPARAGLHPPNRPIKNGFGSEGIIWPETAQVQKAQASWI